MNTVFAARRLAVAGLATAAFHLAAAFFVLVYLVIALPVAVGHWCREVWTRANRRPLHPRATFRPWGVLRPRRARAPHLT